MEGKLVEGGLPGGCSAAAPTAETKSEFAAAHHVSFLAFTPCPLHSQLTCLRQSSASVYCRRMCRIRAADPAAITVQRGDACASASALWHYGRVGRR